MKLFGWIVVLMVVAVIYNAIQSPPRAPASNTDLAAATPAQASELPFAERGAVALAAVDNFDVREFTKDVRAISMAFELFRLWAKIADDAHASLLTPEEINLRSKLISAISTKQKQAFPALRDAYGPAMRTVLWEADGKARTIGAGYRTIEFIAGAFAANRNIKSTHDDMYNTLLEMRFTRAQYKWVDANVEYSYFTLKPPSDGEVVIWSAGGGASRPVK